MLDVRRLRLLSELARRGTIAEVAKTIGYTPSAISQSLTQLERQAGVALLERDGRRVRLTPAAVALVARADRVLAELDAAEADLAAEHETIRGELAIGAFPSAAAELVVPAVVELARLHPELSCAVREHEPGDGIPLLRAGELDLLVSEGYDNVLGAPAGGLESRPVLTEPLRLVLPAGHPHGERLPFARLRDATWIGGLPGTQFAAAIENACRSAGFSPRVVHRADDAYLFQSLVAAGVGVGLLPALACRDKAGVEFATTTPRPPRRHVSALVRRGSARRPAVREILDALRQAGSRRQVE